MIKYLLLSLAALTVSGCGEHSVLTIRNNTTVPLVPEALAGKCPLEVPKVVPAIPGRYTEEESAEVTTRYRLAYVACRTSVKEIQDFYISQKATAEKLNTK